MPKAHEIEVTPDLLAHLGLMEETQKSSIGSTITTLYSVDTPTESMGNYSEKTRPFENLEELKYFLYFKMQQPTVGPYFLKKVRGILQKVNLYIDMQELPQNSNANQNKVKI